MAYKAGFQYLEQRDTGDNIVHAGVVSKKSAFVNALNNGIYDVIAENLRVLYDDFSSVRMAEVRADIETMYEDMRTNPNFGSTAATAQAKLALEYANKAKEYLDQAEQTAESVDVIRGYIVDMQDAMTSIDAELEEIRNDIDDSRDNISMATALVNQTKANADAAKTSEDAASASEAAAKTSETNAKASEVAAGASEANAKTSETNAEASETAAKTSETNAKDSETKAKASETAAKSSETNAKASESAADESAVNALASELAAKASEEAAADSESNAKTSEDHAKASESNAKSSEGKAKVSETNAKSSEGKALTSETNAKASESNAKTSEVNAKASEEAAADSETNAATSESNAKTSETNAKASESAAKTSESNAKTSETNAKASETAAAESESNASMSEANALESKKLAAISAINAGDSEELARTAEVNAKTSETNAASSEANASASENAAKLSADNAKISENKAASSEANAFASETAAKSSETNAASSAANAKTSETNAGASASAASTSEANAASSESNAKTSETNSKASETAASASQVAAKTSETNAASSASAAKASEANAAASESAALTAAEETKRIRDTMTDIMRYKGAVATESALPDNPSVGDVYNITSDGHNVIWDGSAWDSTSAVLDLSGYAEKNSLATVATSGSYNDLANKPYIPSDTIVDTALSESSTNPVQNKVVNAALNTKPSKGDTIKSLSASGQTVTYTKGDGTTGTITTQDTKYSNATTSTAGLMSSTDKSKLDGIASGANAYTHPSTHPASMITGLSTVATSGKYSDISGTPSSLPASDVYDWAKASAKPSYTYSEVGAAASSHTHSQYLTSHQDISGKENSSNKVTSWSSTTTDAHYPSEKLVKSALDGKAASSHTHSQYLTSHQSLSNYSTLANTIKGLSVSGTTITYTKGDGTTGTITTQDTNTNTWRPVQNNLTSDSTTDSLSAYQGKVLKGLVDGKAASSHTHSQYLTSHQDISGKVNKSGDTITGSINRDSGGAWIKGRDNAIIKQIKHTTTSGGSWNPVVSVKTANGNWTIGNVGDNSLKFSYDTDANYNAGTNTSNVVTLDVSAGTIITTANIGSQSVNYANSAGSVAWTNVSGRPSSLPASDVYSWAKASTKPSYTASEVGAAASSHTHSQYLTSHQTITKAMVTNALGYTPPTSDTNTWRGIQNNLTSDSTTDSLSAAQGKVLKGLVDGKAASSHTHSQYLTSHQDISGKANTSGTYSGLSVGNADTVDGLHASHSTGANTIVTRNSGGYTFLNYINSNTANSENPTISQVIVTNGTDHYYRKASLAHLKSSLGSMPASDVYSWAKASTKPSYTASEVGAAASSHTHSQYLTSHQDISGKANTSGTYSGLSVGYASSAGSVAWSNISGKPSTFTLTPDSCIYLIASSKFNTGSYTFKSALTGYDNYAADFWYNTSHIICRGLGTHLIYVGTAESSWSLISVTLSTTKIQIVRAYGSVNTSTDKASGSSGNYANPSSTVAIIGMSYSS